MSDQDAIGVVCLHRWASLDVQRQRLQDDGCRVIVDLAKTDREWLFTTIRQGTVVKVAYAFLLCRFDRGAVKALADFRLFASKLAKLPRGCFGYIKDLETGLLADTAGTRRAMLAVVKDQLARHGKGLRSAENGRKGGQVKEFTDVEWAKAEAIWFNTRRYPTWPAVAEALGKINRDFTVWRAHKTWGPRKFGANRPER